VYTRRRENNERLREKEKFKPKLMKEKYVFNPDSIFFGKWLYMQVETTKWLWLARRY
jgi:hypothetical protein